ncbi:retrovirus-related pol polyprotein from transposon TNT 1-94 [Tanacetum coccineum]
MEQAVEQQHLEAKSFGIQQRQILTENDRLLDQVLFHDIMNVVVNNSVNVNSFVAMKDYMNVSDMFVEKCQKCLELEIELVKKDKVINDISTRFLNLEKHCISLEAQLQEKDTTIKQLKEKVKDLIKNPDKVKNEYDAIETINIELEHSVTKLLSENENLSKEIMHLKQIFKEQFDSIKKSRVDSSVAQMNSKSIENANFQAQIQEKILTIEALENELKRIKGKHVVDSVTPKPKEAHTDYIHKSRENANVLREIVEEVRASNPLDGELDFALKSSTKVCRSQPSRNKKNDKILQPQRSNLKNTVEAQHRKPTLSANKKNSVKTSVCDVNVKRTMLNANSELMCVKCNQCMFDANHDVCFLKYVSDMNVRSKPKSVKKDKTKEEWKPTGHVFTKVGLQWRPTGRKFSLVENACPLTRITTTKEMPLRKTIPLAVTEQTHVVTRIYTRKPNVPIIVGSNRKSKVAKSSLSNKIEPNTSWGSTFSNVPSSSLDECSTIKFGNDHFAKIMGYGDYQVGNVTISRVYYVEGLGHNLFSVGQFCDSDIEVAFCKHTCFVRNLEGVDLLSGSRGTNLYTISLGDMLSSSLICLLSKASKTKSWLWHRCLSHLNFGAINHLARHGLVRDLPKLKFEKDHLYSACAMGKSKKHSHKPKAGDTNQEKLFLLHMDLWGPMRVQSVNGKKYILVIVDDYSRFTWVKFLASKDEAPDFIIRFLKMIQVRLNATIRNIRTDNGTEFVNQTLRDYYESVSISHETSVARTPQQNGVVERRNRTLVEAARTMLIYAKALLFLWAEAVATACYTQNHSIVRLRHGKTPYELLHDKKPDLSYLHVFGALCYPTNDSENLGKLQAKADIGIFIGYAPKKKAYRIYNRRTRRIIETCNVDFDELTAMASEHSSLEPALHEMTPATSSSGLVPNCNTPKKIRTTQRNGNIGVLLQGTKHKSRKTTLKWTF